MSDDPAFRETRWQDFWHYSLGMLAGGKRNAPVTNVRLVDRVDATDLWERGTQWTDRYIIPGAIGTHTFVTIRPGRWGLAIHQIVCLSGGMHMADFPGGGVVANPNILPGANGHLSGWSARKGDNSPFPSQGSFTPPNGAPGDLWQVENGTCGQRGGFLFHNNPELEFTIQFNPPLVSYYRENPYTFITRNTNQQLDISFRFTIPNRFPAEIDGTF